MYSFDDIFNSILLKIFYLKNLLVTRINFKISLLMKFFNVFF